MAKQPRMKAAATLAVPQTRDEVAHAIGRIGDLQRQLVRREAALNDRIAELKAFAEADARPAREEADQLRAGVQVWCEANRDALTNNGKVKTADLGTGKVLWRFRRQRSWCAAPRRCWNGCGPLA